MLLITAISFGLFIVLVIFYLLTRVTQFKDAAKVLEHITRYEGGMAATYAFDKNQQLFKNIYTARDKEGNHKIIERDEKFPVDSRGEPINIYPHGIPGPDGKIIGYESIDMTIDPKLEVNQHIPCTQGISIEPLTCKAYESLFLGGDEVGHCVDIHPNLRYNCNNPKQPLLESCAPHMSFDVNLNCVNHDECEKWPERYKEGTTYKDITDTSKYYLCVDKKSISKTCPSGYVYSQSIGACQPL